MLSAVNHLHSLGIVHADISLENFVVKKDRITLLDFGNAHMITDNDKIYCGKPSYSAPETYSSRTITLAAQKYKVDVFSLGICFFAMLTGTLPYKKIYDK